MTTEADVAWQHYACACLEHDAAHARRACDELRRLHEIPEQRSDDDVVEGQAPIAGPRLEPCQSTQGVGCTAPPD
jgi:hypothetical protein